MKEKKRIPIKINANSLQKKEWEYYKKLIDRELIQKKKL